MKQRPTGDTDRHHAFIRSLSGLRIETHTSCNAARRVTSFIRSLSGLRIETVKDLIADGKLAFIRSLSGLRIETLIGRSAVAVDGQEKALLKVQERALSL